MNTDKITDVKVVSWYDKRKNSILYGIDVKLNNDKWVHASEGKKPIFLKERKDALAKRREIIKQNNLK